MDYAAGDKVRAITTARQRGRTIIVHLSRNEPDRLLADSLASSFLLHVPAAPFARRTVSPTRTSD